MAIFNMSDSSINEYYLNEHGGAHRRIIDNIKKEKDALDAKHDKIENAAISKEKKKALKSKLNDKYNEIWNKSRRSLGRSTDSGFDQFAKFANKHEFKNSDYNTSVQAAKRHIRSLAARNNPKNPEMHRIINQRSKLKEAAEYILSVLDEIDYIEESKKK